MKGPLSVQDDYSGEIEKNKEPVIDQASVQDVKLGACWKVIPRLPILCF